MNDIMLQPGWTIQRLTIRDVGRAEASLIRDIFNACAYIELWDKTFAPTDIETSAEMVPKSIQ